MWIYFILLHHAKFLTRAINRRYEHMSDCRYNNCCERMSQLLPYRAPKYINAATRAVKQRCVTTNCNTITRAVTWSMLTHASLLNGRHIQCVQWPGVNNTVDVIMYLVPLPKTVDNGYRGLRNRSHEPRVLYQPRVYSLSACRELMNFCTSSGFSMCHTSDGFVGWGKRFEHMPSRGDFRK